MVVQKGAVAALPKSQMASSQGQNYDTILQDPLKHVITFIEKKIRNLDKRKAKLDGYRKLVEDGKTLDPDQTAAAAKYGEVLGSLDFAKDLVKSFEATTLEVMKLQRKATRREQIAKEETDNNRVCFVIRTTRIMELLHDNELIKGDFLNGSNGACVVSKLDMDQLVTFYELFVMKSYEAETNIIEDANSAGNHMYELAEARSKDIVGTTYKELRSVLDRITDCKYFEDLPDLEQVKEVHQTPKKDQALSESSESSAEEELDEEKQDDKEEEQNQDALMTNNINDSTRVSATENLPEAAYTTEAPPNTEEILPTNDTAYHSTHAEAPWQQQAIPSKPEAGDYIMHGMNFQYVTGSNQVLHQQHPAYEHQIQTIQDVLAEVQGPCQFLQDSVIDFEVSGLPSNTPVLSFTGMDLHPQQPATTLSSTTLPHQIAPPHMHQVPLEPGFPNQRMNSPTDQNSIHLSNARDSPSHITNTVKHLENVSSTTENMHISPITTSDKTELNPDTVSFHSTSYISNHPTNAAPTGVNQQASMEYTAQPQQPDNLGLGQTTFGGQQQLSGNPHAYQQDDNTASDPPANHIPLPNEQQSGYRSYQPNENPPTDLSAGQSTTNDQVPVNTDMQNTHQDKASELEESQIPSTNESADRDHKKGDGDPQSHEDQNSRYGPRGTVDNRGQQMGGSASRPMRGGYSGNGSGYRTGPINQGGGNGNYMQRNSNNYRPNARFNGNYDSMGRPNNYSGNYQNNQSSYGVYRPQQEGSYMYSRRGTGGNMRGGRGGHQPRGNQGRGGGGNYNRSRTFRPQHSSEQAT